MNLQIRFPWTISWFDAPVQIQVTTWSSTNAGR